MHVRVYLASSGAQYVDGTTDITRTVHFGSPSQHERDCFTRVLQGHIAVASVGIPLMTLWQPGCVVSCLVVQLSDPQKQGK